jgi:hypothetical protein
MQSRRASSRRRRIHQLLLANLASQSPEESLRWHSRSRRLRQVRLSVQQGFVLVYDCGWRFSRGRFSRRSAQDYARHQRISSHSKTVNSIEQGFVHPSCQPRRLHSTTPPGSSLMTLLSALALIAFQCSDESYWYAVAGGAFLTGWYLVYRHYRASRCAQDDDSRKLYTGLRTPLR